MDNSLAAVALPLELVARNPARNIDRRYRISRVPDLFGDLVIELSWGRRGRSGQAKRVLCADAMSAVQLIQATLRRRGGAERRLGVPYRAVTQVVATEAGDDCTQTALEWIAVPSD